MTSAGRLSSFLPILFSILSFSIDLQIITCFLTELIMLSYVDFFHVTRDVIMKTP